MCSDLRWSGCIGDCQQEQVPHCRRCRIRRRPRRRPARHQAVELVRQVQLVRREQARRSRECWRRLEHLAAGVRLTAVRADRLTISFTYQCSGLRDLIPTSLMNRSVDMLAGVEQREAACLEPASIQACKLVQAA